MKCTSVLRYFQNIEIKQKPRRIESYLLFLRIKRVEDEIWLPDPLILEGLRQKKKSARKKRRMRENPELDHFIYLPESTREGNLQTHFFPVVFDKHS